MCFIIFYFILYVLYYPYGSDSFLYILYTIFAFIRVIPEDGPASKKPADVKKLIFCSGNVAVKIEDIRKAAKAESKLAVCRIEQLYPFPYDLILKEYCKYEKAKKVWCQEEHKNQGPWPFVKVRMENLFESKIT